MRLAVGARSDVGRVREGNEDSYLAEDPIYLVADGMGGHLAGEVASSTAVDVISKESKNADPNNPDSLGVIVRDANAAIWERAQSDSKLRGMGTTCTLLLVDRDRAHIAHVGDSRAYLFRAGELSRVTEDHTLVERMVKEGRLSAEEATQHPQRNIVTRGLGIDSEVDVDIETIGLQEGDRILICSDGLTGMVAESDIEDLLANEIDPQAAADQLVDAANEAGGEDNITAIVLDVRSGEGGPAPPPPAAKPAAKDAPTGASDDAGRDRKEPTVVRTERPSTPVPETEPADEEPVRRPRWRRRLVGAVVVIALLVGAAYFGVNYLLDNSFYVSLDSGDTVTIYRGIPEEIAGMSFTEVEQQTDLALTDLPESYHERLQEGMKADSLADAESIVANLERQARSFQEERRRRRNGAGQ